MDHRQQGSAQSQGGGQLGRPPRRKRTTAARSATTFVSSSLTLLMLTVRITHHSSPSSKPTPNNGTQQQNQAVAKLLLRQNIGRSCTEALLAVTCIARRLCFAQGRLCVEVRPAPLRPRREPLSWRGAHALRLYRRRLLFAQGCGAAKAAGIRTEDLTKVLVRASERY